MFTRIAIVISGLVVFIIALSAILHALFFPEAEVLGNWGGEYDMALPTAACLMVTGSALVLLARPPKK